MTATRRFVLTQGPALTAGTRCAVSCRGLLPHARPERRMLQEPFTLGVASGEPAPDGFVLSARLAPSRWPGTGAAACRTATTYAPQAAHAAASWVSTYDDMPACPGGGWPRSGARAQQRAHVVEAGQARLGRG